MNIYDLKSKYGIIIKFPIVYNDKTCNFYFKRMSLGEWLTYGDNINQPSVLGGLLKSLMVEQESEYEFEQIIEDKPGLLVSICQSISNQSDFNDNHKFQDLYNSASHLAMTSIAFVIQHILAAYPSYKLKDILDMPSDDFIAIAAFAEMKIGQPFIIEYQLFRSKFEAEYREANNIPDDKPLDYTYELHVEVRSGVPDTERMESEIETFITENGQMKRGNRTEYLKQKAYQKDILRRRSLNLPPVSMAKYFAELDHEGIDPTQLEQMVQQPQNDPASVAARNAANDLQKKLAQDKTLSLQGVKKNSTYNWHTDTEPNL